MDLPCLAFNKKQPTSSNTLATLEQSPIQVLTELNFAWLQWSYENWYFQVDLSHCAPIHLPLHVRACILLPIDRAMKCWTDGWKGGGNNCPIRSCPLEGLELFLLLWIAQERDWKTTRNRFGSIWMEWRRKKSIVLQSYIVLRTKECRMENWVLIDGRLSVCPSVHYKSILAVWAQSGFSASSCRYKKDALEHVYAKSSRRPTSSSVSSKKLKFLYFFDIVSNIFLSILVSK